MQLHHYITALLKNHNCVIVPGFGGFIGNYEPAKVDPGMALIFPPAKQVLLNPNLSKNDGLLANAVCEGEKITYTDALALIELEVDTWRRSLVAGGRIELGEIGFLYHQNGAVIFEQNRGYNLLLQSFGLKPVPFVSYGIHAKETTKITVKSLPKEMKPTVKPEIPVALGTEQPVVEKPVHAPKREAEKEQTLVIALDAQEKIEDAVEEKETLVVELPRASKKTAGSNRYKYMAAAVALPVLFYSYWIPMRTDALSTGKIQVSDFNPLSSQANRTYDPRKSAFAYDGATDWQSWEQLTTNLPSDLLVYNYELDEETYIPVLLERMSNEVQPTHTSGAYHIIANCFSVKSNADKHVDDLVAKGYNASLAGEHNGLHRVSAGSYATEQEAEAALDSFKAAGNSGWILKP
jgi:hypothetical protein